jgi:hypothetical protein
MRAKLLTIALLPLLLSACHMKISKDEAGNSASVSVGEDGNVSIKAADGAQGMSISVPGFEAKMTIPGLKMGGENMDIDGMKLYPGTKLAAINVNGHDGAGGGVDLHYTSAAAPVALAQYYADAARAQAFTGVNVATANGASTVTAIKPDGDKLTISMNPDPKGGTSGQILVVDSK